MAGEAGLGTLRYLLVAPAGRVRLLLVKYAGAVAFAVAAPLVVALVGAGIGAALFPVGPVTLLSGDSIGAAEAMLRLLLIAAYLAVSLMGLSAIGLFMSTLTDVPVGAMASTVVLSVVSQVLDALPQLEWLHPWLFSHYWLDFADLLRQPVAWDSFLDQLRCCRAATSPCSVRSPTAGSSRRTCSPDSGPRSMRRPAPRLRRAGVIRAPHGRPVRAGRCSARCRNASPGS